MPRLKRDTRRFKQRAIESLILAIELFNRPTEICRADAVLILIQHAFELLLKAAIYQQRGTICEPGGENAFTFDRCVRIAISELSILNRDEATALLIIDGLRNCVMHNQMESSEESLYLQIQVGVTLFGDLLQSAFNERLAESLPNRVLPISTEPPPQMHIFMDNEFKYIKSLLHPGRRQQSEARNRLKQFLVIENNLSEGNRQPSERDINVAVQGVKEGQTWQDIFPSIATLRIDSEGSGPSISIRFTRSEGAPPVRLVREGEPGASEAELVREVNLLDRFNLNLTKLAGHVGLTRPKCLALIRYLDMQSDPECYREIPVDSSIYKRYSQETIRRINNAKDEANMEEVWKLHGPGRKPG